MRHRIRRALNPMFRHTIWAKGAIPADEWKYRNLKRVWLPLYDVMFVWAGLIAVRFGIPSLDTLLPSWMSDTLGYTLVLVAFLCLVGVAVPRLWFFEVGAKTALLSILITYFLALRVVAGDTGTDTRAFISVVTLIAAIPILIRMNILSEEARARRVRG